MDGGVNVRLWGDAGVAVRLAAFVLDLLAGGALVLLFCIIAWAWWLAASSGGTREPSDAAIYAGLLVASLAFPIWAAIAIYGLSRWGQTPGLAAMSLQVQDPDGKPPHPLRAAVRVVILGPCALAALATPLLIAGVAAAAAQRTLPLLVGLIALLPVLPVAADIVVLALTRPRRALHDLAAHTSVVRLSAAPEA